MRVCQSRDIITLRASLRPAREPGVSVVGGWVQPAMQGTNLVIREDLFSAVRGKKKQQSDRSVHGTIACKAPLKRLVVLDH